MLNIHRFKECVRRHKSCHKKRPSVNPIKLRLMKTTFKPSSVIWFCCEDLNPPPLILESPDRHWGMGGGSSGNNPAPTLLWKDAAGGSIANCLTKRSELVSFKVLNYDGMWLYQYILKTTFVFNFDLYQAFKQHGYTKNIETERSCQLKIFSLIACKLLIRKKPVNSENLNKKSSSLYC